MSRQKPTPETERIDSRKHRDIIAVCLQAGISLANRNGKPKLVSAIRDEVVEQEKEQYSRANLRVVRVR